MYTYVLIHEVVIFEADIVGEDRYLILLLCKIIVKQACLAFGTSSMFK